MLPEIHVLNHVIPTYSVTAILGVVVVLMYFYTQKWDPAVNFEVLTIWGLIGTLVGAKLLYLLLSLPEFIHELPYLFTDPHSFLNKYVYSGLVFFGGLYGCILTVLIYCRMKKMPLYSVSAVIPAFPLFHAFGRIGCFFTGCCYGVPWQYGITFVHSSIAPNGIPLMPVQLMEAFAELVFFLVLFLLRRRFFKALGLYLILYGITRFLLEFLRGDVIRGFIGPLSVSQWISLFSTALGFVLIFIFRERKA